MPIVDDTLPKRFKATVDRYPETAVCYTKDGNGDFQAIPYRELWEKIRLCGHGLLALGVSRHDHVGLISDNRWEWPVIDHAILGLGAADVPRGSDSTEDEIAYILNHADCEIAFAENRAQLQKIASLRERMPLLKRVILIEGLNEDTGRGMSGSDLELLGFEDVIRAGEKHRQENPEAFDREMAKGRPDEVATLIYTSGTTGEPKGVMLTHRNYLFQLDRLDDRIELHPGDIFLSVLPIWHSFERAVDYYVFSRAASVAYSKPVGSVMLADMARIRPHWMTSVPRIWEGIRSAVFRNVNKEGGVKKSLFYFFVGVGEAHAYFWNMARGLLPQFSKRNRAVDIALSIIPLVLLTPFKLLGNVLVFGKLKQKLGGRFKAGVSGGGALPGYVDRFFQAAGIKLLEGYGLTETAPVISVRFERAPKPGTVGPVLRDVEYRIVGEDGAILPPGKKGVLYIRSEQVMKGYYKKPDETAKVLQDGWMNTGDIVVATVAGDLKILGREKDTIVLLGGENIEPQPIEEKLVQSDYIDQVMVVGQDQKFLGTLIVPNLDRVAEYAGERSISYIEREELLDNPQVQELFHNEIQNLISAKAGFKPFERIFRFTLLTRPFEVGKELTHTLKVRRKVVNEEFRHQIARLFL